MESKYYFSIIIITFLFFLLPNVFFRCCETKEQLQICVKYEKTVAERETKIALEEFRINNQIKELKNLPENFQNGECFGILIGPDDNAEMGHISLTFAISVKPMENEYQPSADENNENPPDDEDIRTMVRRILFRLFEPNLAKVYTVNLGKIDPPELYFNRTILVDKKNDLVNYHALLFAKMHKNGQNVSDYYLFGYAKLSKINDEEASSSSSENKFNEYKLKIPINSCALFKHFIHSFGLQIYSFEKNKNHKEKMENREENPQKECAICLESFEDGKLTMKLHEDYQHGFHKKCITKWVLSQEQLRCPICNRNAFQVTTADLQPIFDGPDQPSTSFLSLNPLAFLFQLANGKTENDQIKRKQAKLAIKKTEEFVKSREAELKQIALGAEFLNLNLSAEQKLFEIGPDGVKIHPIVEELKKQISDILSNGRQNSEEIIAKAEQMNSLINRGVRLALFIENMQLISEN